ncbi:shikimate kinase [Varibaculum vaginae]|uniref:shikimate kinase n=1 Tax=Varibaculum vaginae TaxID=2364797 RepID=UPI001358FC75|nr:shikimate kinase [Varibaculum vaginae]
MARKVFLIGLPGSGKSSIAAALAKRFAWKLVDTDVLVASKLGVPLATAVISAGEKRYRQVEQEVVRSLLKAMPAEDTIVAMGSGALDNPQTRQELNELPAREIIELVIDLSTMADRAGLNRPRSLGLGMPRAWLRQMGEERRQRWQTLNPHAVTVSDLSLAAACEEVAHTLEA